MAALADVPLSLEPVEHSLDASATRAYEVAQGLVRGAWVSGDLGQNDFVGDAQRQGRDLCRDVDVDGVHCHFAVANALVHSRWKCWLRFWSTTFWPAASKPR